MLTFSTVDDGPPSSASSANLNKASQEAGTGGRFLSVPGAGNRPKP